MLIKIILYVEIIIVNSGSILVELLIPNSEFAEKAQKLREHIQKGINSR